MPGKETLSPIAPRSTGPIGLGETLGIHKKDRVHVFIDALNLMGMLRSMQKKLDYKLFMAFLKTDTRLVRANYYAVLRDDAPESAHNVIDMIEYGGFNVYRKVTREVQERDGAYRFRGSIVPEMTVGLIDAAENGADHIVLVTGDGELISGIEAAKARGARVTLLSEADSTSDDIRRKCDDFFPFENLPERLFFR